MKRKSPEQFTCEEQDFSGGVIYDTPPLFAVKSRRAAMNKGINRNVIEIVDTDSELFERAILFVRPHERGREPAALERGAHRFLSHTRIRRRALHRGRRLAVAVKYMLAALIGAGAAALLLIYVW